MRLTKEDLMKLSKERLVELLLETQTEQETTPNAFSPHTIDSIPCWAPNGYCPNKFHDCIDCPKTYSGGVGSSTTWFSTASSDGSNLRSNCSGQASGNDEKQPLND
jgi:hypothetical protein